MLKRAMTAIVLVGFVFLMLFLGTIDSIYLDMLVLAFAIVGSYEIYHSFRMAGYINKCIPLIVLCAGIYPLWYFMGLTGLAIIFSAVTILSLAIFTFTPEMKMNDLMATVFSYIYPFGLLSLAFVVINKYPCGGIFTVSFAVFLPVFSDTFAYLVGSTLGKRKLCPSISPKKTVAGGVGGVMGSILCAVVFFLLFDYFKVIPTGYVSFTDNVGLAAGVYVLLGFLGGVLAEIGDLSASRIKRVLGIKDFGNIFPGHGGVLDRLDSIMFTLVMLFITFEIVY